MHPRWRAFGIWLAAVVTVGLLFFTYRHLETLTAGGRKDALDPFLSEMTAVFAVGLLFFAVRAVVRRWPIGGAAGWHRLPLYVVAALVFAAVHTTMMWGSRAVLFPLAGLGPYDYGRMPLRYAMELPMQLLSFALMVAALVVAGERRRVRERLLHTARLEASLADAELRNLRLQLQPHFLFNALNTISATMYDDPAAADEMLDRLAELLRASLHTARRDTVSLGEELRVLGLYLELLRARFGERLRVTLDVEPGLAAVPVPSLLLQPLVENAVRHGNAEREGQGAVTVRARRAGRSLVLEVEDDGPGLPTGRDPLAGDGVGLRATAERLRLLYGDVGGFSAGNAGDGFRVRCTIPLAEAA